MQNIKRNPYLLFLPFLIIFVAIVLKMNNDALLGDEGRYLTFARNLLNGFYSPPPPDINLWNGPGYPFILMPFVALRLPLISITLLNAVFYYLSIVLLFKALRYFVSYKKSLAFSVFWGLYYTAYIQLPEIYTESLMYFLISLLILCTLRAYHTAERKYIWFTGLVLGYIVLTKIIFGYVILLALAVACVLYLATPRNINYRKNLLVLTIAFATYLPWLLHTYSLTHKHLYFGNSGGVLLYWMSTPYKEELGDWKEPDLTTTYKQNSAVPDNPNRLLKEHHQKSHNEIFRYQGVERDEAYKKIALENIRSNPGKYFKNWLANLGRLLFDFPNSYVFQSPSQLFKLPTNSITVLLSLACVIPTLLNWCRIPFSIRFLLLLTLIYLAATSLLSAYSRFFNVIVPVLLLWIAYIIQQTVIIKKRFRDA